MTSIEVFITSWFTFTFFGTPFNITILEKQRHCWLGESISIFSVFYTFCFAESVGCCNESLLSNPQASDISHDFLIQNCAFGKNICLEVLPVPREEKFISTKYFSHSTTNEIQCDVPAAKKEKDPQNNSLKIINIIINTSPVTAGEPLHSGAFGEV